jgi:hypothetical protein
MEETHMRTFVLSFLTAALFAASAATAADTVPNRIAQAKAGEWVLMEDVSGEESGELTKVTLIAIDAESFTVLREHIDAEGNVVESKEHVVKLADYNRRMDGMAARAKEITSEFVFIGEKEYPVTAVHIVSETKDENGAEREFKIWISEELPIGGVAKTWSSDVDFPSAEVVDFGFAQ